MSDAAVFGPDVISVTIEGPPSPPGPAGPSNNTRSNLDALKAANPNDLTSLYDGSAFFWVAGDFTGLFDDVNYVASTYQGAPAGAWLRQSSSKATFQFGKAGSAMRSSAGKHNDIVSVLDFIPVQYHADIRAGTSTMPIGAYVQLAYTGPKAGSGVFWPAGQYYVEAEITTNGVRTIGAGPNSTEIVAATAGMRSVFRNQGQNNLIDGVYVNASAAQCAVYMDGANGSTVARCWFDSGQIANVLFPEAGNSSGFVLFGNLFRLGGRAYPCGTGSIAANGQTITGLTVDPTKLAMAAGTGPRPAYDFVQIGTLPAVEFTATSSTTATLPFPIRTAQTSVPITFLQGGNVVIMRAGDASKIKSIGNTYQRSPGIGLDCSSLYGFTSIGDIFEYNHYHAAFGRARGGGEQPTWNVSVTEAYVEAAGSGVPFYHGSSHELKIDNTMGDGIGADGFELMMIPDTSTIRDLDLTVGGRRGQKRNIYQDVRYPDPTTNAADTLVRFGSASLFTQAAGKGPVVITLDGPTSPTNASNLLAFTEMVTTIVLAQMNNNQVTIRSNKALVNGVAADGNGYSNFNPPASYPCVATCRYAGGDLGWVITVAKAS